MSGRGSARGSCRRMRVSVRLGEDPKVCLLIVIGLREDVGTGLLAVEDGHRESTEIRADDVRYLERRGLNEPKLVVGDSARSVGPPSHRAGILRQRAFPRPSPPAGWRGDRPEGSHVIS